jgi:hypothetical protein
MILTPKNWNSFQHYKDREPSWIKLHKSLLTNYEYICLPIASRALAPMLWLLASEYKDGIIDASLDKIAYRVGMTRGQVADALSPLVDGGFFDASEPIAECNQPAILEKEDIGKRNIEKIEREKEPRASALSFDRNEFVVFWDEWPNKVGKSAAVKALASARKRGIPFDTIMAGVRAYIRTKPPDRSWMNPATFLNGARWEDQPAPPTLAIAKPLSEFQRKQQETNDVRAQLRNYANGGEGGGNSDRLLPGNSGQRPQDIRGGTGQVVLQIPRASGSGGD